jgi:hypothetical protein
LFGITNFTAWKTTPLDGAQWYKSKTKMVEDSGTGMNMKRLQ